MNKPENPNSIQALKKSRSVKIIAIVFFFYFVGYAIGQFYGYYSSK